MKVHRPRTSTKTRPARNIGCKMKVANTNSTILNANTMPMSPHTFPISPTYQQHTLSSPPPPAPLQSLHIHPAFNYNAGHTLTSTYELLEQIFLSLPATSLLLSQRVNQRFRSVIATSSRLQQRLFFTPKKPKAYSNDFKALLNPVLTRQDVRLAFPLFFDHAEVRLSREWKLGVTRLYCHSITATTVFVYLEFSDEEPERGPRTEAGSSTTVWEEQCLVRTFVPASWEKMYLAQPSCFFSWRLRLTEDGGQSLFSGILKGERTMGRLFEGLTEEVLVRR